LTRSWRLGRTGRGWYSLFFLLLVGGASPACVASTSIVPRNTVELAPPAQSSVAWFGPDNQGDNASLTRWRRSVGPPVTQQAALDAQHHDAITIVSWNTAVGAADVVGFVQSLPVTGRPLVLLLQEVYRGGPTVPSSLDASSAFAGRLGGAAGGPDHRPIEEVGRQLGLAVYYVPSMRNGGSSSDEDRGNAILSNLPLTDLRAVELPFERQRRVAIAATLVGQDSMGDPWHIRVVSAHLDNLAGVKRGWIGAEYGRARQARSLASLLNDGEPTILAGDFNTWFGFSDQAYRETARAFPDTHVTDRRPTFRGLLRLDHVFYRLAPGWRAEFQRASSRYGSDHYPLVGSLQFN
jgi:endonuclease/exonuclease/phosphatase family metal-dependent hydrolase